MVHRGREAPPLLSRPQALGHLPGVSKDGKRLITGSLDKTVRIYDVENGTKSLNPKKYFINGAELKVITIGKEIHALAPTEDGSKVLIGCSDNNAYLWDLETGKEVQAFKGHSGQVESLFLSKDGKSFATGSFDGTARLWDLATGKTVQTFMGHAHAVNALALSSDAKWLVTAGHLGKAYLWDLRLGRQVAVFSGPGGAIRAVAMSKNDKWFVTGGENGATQWDCATGKEIRSFKAGKLNAVTLSADGKYLVTGGADKIARLWNVDTGEEIRTFSNKGTDEFHALALTNDGKSLVSGNWKHVHVWNLETGKHEKELVCGDFLASTQGVALKQR